jgi:hypothetical protein
VGGYNAEWGHVSRQLLALAEATPAQKFAWRPAPGVRSTREVYACRTCEFLARVKISGKDVSVDKMGLRIIVHANEHRQILMA